MSPDFVIPDNVMPDLIRHLTAPRHSGLDPESHLIPAPRCIIHSPIPELLNSRIMPFNPSETILDNLLARTKAEIDRLRKLLQADVKSNLNKADMAVEVADYIRHEGEFWIRRFPQRDIRIIRGLLSLQRGSSGFNVGLTPYPTALEKLGLVYSERNASGETIYRCTDEMYDAFKRGLPNASAAMYCMNYATYEQYLLGLTNIYGIVPYPMAYDIIIDAADSIETEKFDRQRNPFAFAHETLLLDLYSITVKGKVYVHSPAIFNPEELLDDINYRLDLHYYDNFLPAAPSSRHCGLDPQSRHPELVSGSRNPIPAPLSSRAESRHAELDSASPLPRPTRKKFSLQAIFAAGADHDGYPFVPSTSRPGNTLPRIIDTLFRNVDSTRHSELDSGSRHPGLDPQSPRHAELDSASPSRHSGLDPESPASLAAYLKFALWHDAVDYESPHKHLAMDLIFDNPRFKSDSGLSREFWDASKDHEDNVPIWSRLGYTFKEYYLKFGQPDASTIKPATNFGIYDPSYITSLRRKKPKK